MCGGRSGEFFSVPRESVGVHLASQRPARCRVSVCSRALVCVALAMHTHGQAVVWHHTELPVPVLLSWSSLPNSLAIRAGRLFVEYGADCSSLNTHIHIAVTYERRAPHCARTFCFQLFRTV